MHYIYLLLGKDRLMIGIDLGSRNVKIVRFVAGKIAEKKIYDTIKFYRHYGKNINNRLQLDWERLELPLSLIHISEPTRPY